MRGDDDVVAPQRFHVWEPIDLPTVAS